MLQYLKPKNYPFNSCFNIGKRRYSSTAVDFPNEKRYNSSKQRETRRNRGGGGSVPVRALWVVSAFAGFFVLVGIVYTLRYFILNDFSSFSRAERQNIVSNTWIIAIAGLSMLIFCAYHIWFAYATWELRPTGILVRHFFGRREYAWEDLKQICVCRLKASRGRETPVICCCTDADIDFRPPKGPQKEPSWRGTEYAIYHPRKVLALPYSEALAEEIKQYYPQIQYLFEV